MTPLLLAIDVGLSAIKVAAFRTDGVRLALSETVNQAVQNRGRESSFDLNILWNLVCRLIAEVVNALDDPRAIVGVGLSGHGNGVCLVKPDGSTIAAITSMDLRASEVVDRWHQDGTDEKILAVTGNHLWAGQPLPLLYFLQQEGLKTDAARLLFCKDWIRFKLTGEFATDRGEASAAGLLDVHSGEWASPLFLELGLGKLLGKSTLPKLIGSTDTGGLTLPEIETRTGLPARLPVVGGSIDLALSSAGEGLLSPTDLHVTAGTWSINQRLTASTQLPPDCLQIIFSPLDNQRLLVESSPTSGINLRVLDRLLGSHGLDYDRCDQIVDEVRLEKDDPIYLPYPAGAWDLPKKQAALCQLSTDINTEKLVATVYEGIVLGHVRQIAKMRRIAPIQRLIVCGGMTRSAAWCQLLSDYANLPVVVSTDPHSGLWGAALCVLQGLDLPIPANVKSRKTIEPRSGQVCLARQERFHAQLKE